LVGCDCAIDLGTDVYGAKRDEAFCSNGYRSSTLRRAGSQASDEVGEYTWFVDFPTGAMIGFFLGFAFGVGCALAVMYAIYMGGYRAAVREMQAAEPTSRLTHALANLKAGHEG